MTMHPRYIHDTQRYKTSECTKYNGKIHSRYMTDTFKQVTIHKKYMVSGGIGPIFGGKVALTRARSLAPTHPAPAPLLFLPI